MGTRRVDYCAKDSGLETADLGKLVPFTLENKTTILEVAKLLTIHFVHTLKSPVIVTPTFLDSVVSFLESQPKNTTLNHSNHTNNNKENHETLINGDHMVECMSTLDTIRALCFPGLFRGLFTSVQIVNYIVEV